MINKPLGLFIAGTDTDVGKTYVTALIARELCASGRRVGVYKPVASGCSEVDDRLVSDDAVQLWEAAGRPGDLERVCPQRFAAPLAPPQAARAEGREVDSHLLRSGLDYWRERSEIVLVEGAGGLLSPVTDEDYVADLAEEFGWPTIVVARNALGTINHTLSALVVAATFRESLQVAGVVLNNCLATPDPSAATNADELRRRCMPPVLATVGWQSGFDAPIDWWALAEGKIMNYER
jgi:dethiobiotin synthetase